MSDEAIRAAKQALITIKKLQAKLDADVQTRTEPIAIIGMGCRLPGGGDTPEAFWQALKGKVDAITEVPAERWSLDGAEPGAMGNSQRAARWGAFLKNVDLFDAPFFGITPREAKAMDPQQRLLLEVTWEALERAGQVPEALSGTRTGVFLGVVHRDYEIISASSGRAQDVYTITGNGHCFPAGRLSYTLGLQGPSMAVDTACSSSLVAIHLACQSLHAGESTMALAGGVSLMLAPFMTRLVAASQALSPDGRSRTFDAEANGFVRGEGCGMLVLKRLSSALSDGDPILALIRGSAVNQDGRSSGLTTPNVLAQKALLRQALDNAGVKAVALSYIETHGTGTPLGDPIEMEALADVMGAPRPDGSSCVLGAVKTNIAHSEAAAGVASVIKIVLALQNEAIPPNLNFKTLNPRISLDGTAFLLPQELQPWPGGSKTRLAGVSSFGMSGTNAHAILEEAPRRTPAASAAEDHLSIVPLSARSPQALVALAQSYQAALANPGDVSLADVAYTASVRRSHYEHRVAILARSTAELGERLKAVAQGIAHPEIIRGEGVPETRHKIAFVFPGQGSQWLGMGRELLATEPVFLSALKQCDEAIQREVGWSVREALLADANRSRLDQIDVIQPALFALGVSLAALWRSWGIEPDIVIGHSMGEVGAAYVAGALSLSDAVRVICRRSLLLRRLLGRGAMALVELPLREAEQVLSSYEGRLAVAASNSPRSTVLSGDPDALAELLETLTKAGIFCRRIKVDVASHSPQVDELQDDLLAALSGLSASVAKLPLLSTVMNQVCEGVELDATYWVRNLRAPVLFSQGISQLLETGHTLFIEMSPHPILLPAVEEALVHAGRKGAGVPSMHREQPARKRLHESLAALYCHGHEIKWQHLHPAGGRCIPLPTYPFQRERYWIDTIETAAATSSATPVEPQQPLRGHPLLGTSFSVAVQNGTRFWERELSVAALPFLADHQVAGASILSATCYLEMAQAAAAEAFGWRANALGAVAFERMLALPATGARTVQAVLTEDKNGEASFQVFSKESGTADWVRHMVATLAANKTPPPGTTMEAPAEARKRCSTYLSAEQHYAQLRERGIEYGSSFRGVEQIWLGAGEVLGRVRAPEGLLQEGAAYHIHPALLDACAQVGASLFLNQESLAADKAPLVPIGVESVQVYKKPGKDVWVYGRLRPSTSGNATSLMGDVFLLAEDGQVLAVLNGFAAQQYVTAPAKPWNDYENWLYAFQWERQNHRAATPANLAEDNSGVWIILMDGGGLGEVLAAQLDKRGRHCVKIRFGERSAQIAPDLYEVNPTDRKAFRSILKDLLAEYSTCRGIVYLGALDSTASDATTTESLIEDQKIGILSVPLLVQSILQRKWRNIPGLWLVTRGAQPVGTEVTALSVAQAPLWGLGRTINQEHPEVKCSLLDLGAAWTMEESAAILLSELLAKRDAENQIALRLEGRYVARLVRRSFRALSHSALPGGTVDFQPQIRPDRTYLVSGGLGGLGIQLAKWLVTHGARHLMLLGRSEATAATKALITGLQESGATVVTPQVDVSRQPEVARALAYIDQHMSPLGGIIHAPMVIDDRTVLELDDESYQRVMTPKILGAWNLHALTADRGLDFFVLFSSAATLLTMPGQGSYAAANTFLDVLAHYRRSKGLCGLSIDWGFFASAGIMARQQDLSVRMAHRGLEAFEPEQGFQIMGRLIAERAVQAGVLALDLRKWLEFYPSAVANPLFSTLRAEVKKAAPNTPEPSKFQTVLSAANPSERAALLEQRIGEQIAQVAHQDSARLNRLLPFTRLGMDSLMTLELRNRLESDLGISLAVTVLYAYPTIASLAEHLLGQLGLAMPKGAPILQLDSASSGATAAPAEANEVLAWIEHSIDRLGSRMK